MPFVAPATETRTNDPATLEGPPPDGRTEGQTDWPQRRRITAWLMGMWGLVTVGGAYFARDLSTRFAGWPLGFWVAAQGAPIAYGLLVWTYDLSMRRLDRQTHARPDRLAAGQGGE